MGSRSFVVVSYQRWVGCGTKPVVWSDLFRHCSCRPRMVCGLRLQTPFFGSVLTD